VRSILPEWLYEKISNDYLKDYLYEIRIRLGKPIIVGYKNNYEKITFRDGYDNRFIIATADLIKYIISSATKHSLYAYNDEIKEGYITTDNGIRIGICGEVVYNNGEISTLKNITSLNLRISHEVYNCSRKIIDLIASNGLVKNTLIISPPGAGKTTIIRDITKKLSNEKNVTNILVVDERFEIAGSHNAMFDLGDGVDVISGSKKSFAFEGCLKTMNPSVIVTDEISKEEDIEEIKQAIRSGVKVIATAHAENVNDLKIKKYLSSLIDGRYFERVVVLSKRNGVGTIESVYDENLKGIYLPYLIWS